ncbi:MAG: hypothetical protein AAB579_00770 [Patescibacteria group bacterium]
MLGAQQLNGTIMIGGSGADGVCRKVFDLKITSTWPIISISTKQPPVSNRDKSYGKLISPLKNLSAQAMA